MPKPKAINRKKLVAFVLPIIRKEKLPMSEELEKLRHKQYPKISDFGAVADVGKRPISLWHKQTPGIPRVDFYPDRLYNILRSRRFQKWSIRTQNRQAGTSQQG